MTSRGKHTQGLRPPWKKGQSGNPRGRPPAPWRAWLAAQEPSFREALAALARDARIKPETRARIFMFFVDHAHGHPKQPVESEWPEVLHLHVDPSDVGPGRGEDLAADGRPVALLDDGADGRHRSRRR